MDNISNAVLALSKKAEKSKYCGTVEYEELGTVLTFNVVAARGLKTWNLNSSVIEIYQEILTKLIGDKSLEDYENMEALISEASQDPVLMTEVYEYMITTFGDQIFWKDVLQKLLDLDDETIEAFQSFAVPGKILTLFILAASIFLTSGDTSTEDANVEAGNGSQPGEK